jgi:hypothetical protein
MRVYGQEISPDLAMEIICRTDSFFVNNGFAGNNKNFNDAVLEGLGLPKVVWETVVEDQKVWDDFKTKLKVVPGVYVHNGWISNSFIFGACGWCHPNGKIHYLHNVGKWPSVNDILEDWQKIAEAWPVLELEACLMGGESSEEAAKPLAIINVSGGTATLHDPNNYKFLNRFGMTDTDGMWRIPEEQWVGSLLNRNENYFTVEEVVSGVKKLLAG